MRTAGRWLGVDGSCCARILSADCFAFFPAKLDLSIRMFYALLPLVLITGIATNCTAVLNTFDLFALPALAPVVIALSIILGTLLLGSRPGI